MTVENSQLVSLGGQSPPPPPALFGMTRSSLPELMQDMGEPAFRGTQLAEAFYKQWVEEIGEISTLSRELRSRLLAADWVVGRPRIDQVFRSADGTERYLVRGQSSSDTVETVWM